MIKIDENTNIYVRIDTDKELELFCNFINRNYPNKFCWASDIPREYIDNKYIYQHFSLRGTLYIGTDYSFYQSSAYYKVGEIHLGVNTDAEVVSVYDIIGENNDIPIIPDWIKEME